MKYKKGLSSRQMSSLNRKLRKKGLNKRQAYIQTGIAKVLSKTDGYKGKQAKKQKPYLDYDGDGKVNKYDCQPYNKWKQDQDSYGEGYSDGLKNLEKHELSTDIEYDKDIKDYSRGHKKGIKKFNKELAKKGGYYKYGGAEAHELTYDELHKRDPYDKTKDDEYKKKMYPWAYIDENKQ